MPISMRYRKMLLGLMLALTIVLPTTTLFAPRAEAFSTGVIGSIACNLIPDPIARVLCLSPAVRKVVVTAAGDAASSVVNAAITAWTAPVREFGRFLGEGIVSMIANVPPPDTQAGLAFSLYENTLGLEYGMISVFFLIGLLFCLTNPKRLLKLCAATLYAMIGGIVAPGIFEILIIMSNEVSKSVSVGNAGDFSANLGALFGITPGGPAIGGFTLTLFMVFFGTILFWENVFRSAGIPVLNVLVPLALLGLFLGSWGESKLRKLVFFILGLILAQPLVVIVLNIGVAIGGSYNSTDAIGSLIQAFFGLTIVVIATLLPFAIMHEAPLVGAKLLDAGRSRSEGSDDYYADPVAEKRSMLSKAISRVPFVDNPLVPLAVGFVGTPAAGLAAAGIQATLQGLARGDAGGLGASMPDIMTYSEIDPVTGHEVNQHVEIRRQQSTLEAVRSMGRLLNSMNDTEAEAA